MSRFVRLADGHYINLDLVTDIFLWEETEESKSSLTFYYSVPDGEGEQIDFTQVYGSTAEAKAELARILPESTYPDAALDVDITGIVGNGSQSSIEAAIGAQYLKPTE